MQRSHSLFLLLASATILPAAGIEGEVVIRRRVTKKKVTAPVDSYARGVLVPLQEDTAADPLEQEKSRVVIYLEGELPSAPAPAEIVQRGRQFQPETLGIPAGSTVSFPNHDPIFHNVFSLSKPKRFDLGNYARNHSRSVHFPVPGIVFVHCHLHSNMAAAILVAPNSFVTTADKSGRFRLPDVPPGEYTAVAWHRGAGFFRRSIKVGPDAVAHARFLIPLSSNGSTPTLAGN